MADVDNGAGGAGYIPGTTTTQAEADALNAVEPEPAVSVGTSWTIAIAALVGAVIAAAVLPVAPAALFVIAAALAIGYAVQNAAVAVWQSFRKVAPEIALPLLRVWNSLPQPVQRAVKYSYWLLLLLIIAAAVSRYARGKNTRGAAK